MKRRARCSTVDNCFGIEGALWDTVRGLGSIAWKGCDWVGLLVV